MRAIAGSCALLTQTCAHSLEFWIPSAKIRKKLPKICEISQKSAKKGQKSAKSMIWILAICCQNWQFWVSKSPIQAQNSRFHARSSQLWCTNLGREICCHARPWRNFSDWYALCYVKDFWSNYDTRIFSPMTLTLRPLPYPLGSIDNSTILTLSLDFLAGFDFFSLAYDVTNYF